MKKWLTILLTVCFLVCAGDAQASKASYTLSTKTGTALQNEADRGIAVPDTAAVHDTIAGESPVTGMPWEGTYLPVLVQITNTTDTVKYNGRSIKTSGVGRRAPWGMQYADIVYEERLIAGGGTRFTALFSDCFAQGQPEGGVGPVRSCRYGSLLLRQEWHSALVYAGTFAGSFSTSGEIAAQLLSDPEVQTYDVLMNVYDNRFRPLSGRVRDMGKKAPDNLNVDIAGLRAMLIGTYDPAPQPFLFKDGDIYGDAYAKAGVIHLDWGYKYNISHFVYDESGNCYLRYSGAGKNAAKWVPFTAFASAQDNSTENSVQLTFANVIVQRVTYATENGSKSRLTVNCVGRGNADIFIDGRYIPGYWARASISDPTVFYDDQGNELQLNRGKTYIAHLGDDDLCLFSDGD